MGRGQKPKPESCTSMAGELAHGGVLRAAPWPQVEGLLFFSSDQPDDELPTSKQGLAGLADDNILHLLALLPVLHGSAVLPGHHHLEVGTVALPEVLVTGQRHVCF